MTLRGARADGPLVNPNDYPACPEQYHEAIALLAAWKHGKIYATGDSVARLAGYRSEAQAIIDAMGEYLTEQEAPVFQRRVARALPERYPRGWMRWIP